MRDFAFMPLDVVRLRDSGLTAKASGDEFRAAVLLWCASWHQVPAASLPDDDDELANICGYSRARREWVKIAAGARRGWVKCADGRLYHDRVAAKALEAWIEKLASAIGGAVGNAKRWNVEIDTDLQRAQFSASVAALRALDPQSRTLRKKVVAVLTMPSRGESPPESPPDSHGDSPPDSAPDRKGQRQRQGLKEIPPVAPKGASGPIGLKAWLEAVKAAGEKPIPDGDPVFAYADEVELPRDFLHLAWLEFRHRYTQPGQKRYRDWRAVFRRAVRGNWLKLWFLDGKAYALTTAGQQARLAREKAA